MQAVAVAVEYPVYKQTRLYSAQPQLIDFAKCARTRNIELAVAELKIIKNQNPADIASAIFDVFHRYANPTLNALFLGVEGVEFMDFEFINTCMLKVFGIHGNGSYSCVYKLSDDWAIKINVADTMWSLEDSAFDWLAKCTTDQANIFVPKIASIRQAGNFYVAVIERLDENEWFQPPTGFCFTDLVECRMESDFCFVNYMYDLREYPGFMTMCAMNRDHVVSLAEMYESVRNDTSASEDISSYNVMMRGKVPVITDPFASGTGALSDENSKFDWKMSDA